MKKLFRNTSVLVKPMFCITPKTFYAINMISSFWFTFFFANYYMVASKRQRDISMPVISIINGTQLSIMLYQLLNNIFFPFSNWENSYLPVQFQNPKNNNFPRCSTSSFPISLSAKVSSHSISPINASLHSSSILNNLQITLKNFLIVSSHTLVINLSR